MPVFSIYLFSRTTPRTLLSYELSLDTKLSYNLTPLLFSHVHVSIIFLQIDSVLLLPPPVYWLWLVPELLSLLKHIVSPIILMVRSLPGTNSIVLKKYFRASLYPRKVIFYVVSVLLFCIILLIKESILARHPNILCNILYNLSYESVSNVWETNNIFLPFRILLNIPKRYCLNFYVMEKRAKFILKIVCDLY